MNQIHNPTIPFNAPIPGGMHPGKIIKVHGSVPPTSHRFAVNLLSGPMGDIALHVSPKFHEKHVVRNSVQNMHWGHEEKHGHMPIHPGQTFELLILCDPHHYKIAFNGHHFTEFTHRIPYTAVTNLAIDGEVTVFSINFEGSSPHGSMGFTAPPTVPYVPVPGHVPHQPVSSHAPGMSIPYPAHAGAIHHAGSPYPHSNPVYPPPAGYPTSIKAMKKQKKAQKKALKYGIPIAGAGIGAYALHKGLGHGFGHHGFHRRSSSSSSSSSD